MTQKDITKKYTLSEIKQQIAKGESKTDWEKVSAKTDSEIERAVADDPDTFIPDAGFWKNAKVVNPRGKTSAHLRLDSDVFAWFKAQGKGHLTLMNAVLRSYVDAHKN
jgi:uncharacterized protein (DUF4415 family)